MSFCIFIFPLGVPLIYASNLWHERNLLDPGQAGLEENNGELKALDMALEERQRLENNDETRHIKSLSFLYDCYEPKYYYFEVVETIRKLMLTGGLVVLGPGASSMRGAKDETGCEERSDEAVRIPWRLASLLANIVITRF